MLNHFVISAHSSQCRYFAIESTITSEVYLDLIMQFISLFNTFERVVVIQEDNVHPHVSMSTMAFLRLFSGDKLIFSGLWPPHSPNLNL